MACGYRCSGGTVVKTFALVLAAQFAFVFFKALQQRNVIHNNHIAVFPTSMAMAVFEVMVYGTIAATFIQHGALQALPLAVAMGLGGGLGCNVAMLLHNRYFMKGGK